MMTRDIGRLARAKWMRLFVCADKCVACNRKCEYHRADKNVYGKKKGVHEIDHELRSAV